MSVLGSIPECPLLASKPMKLLGGFRVGPSALSWSDAGGCRFVCKLPPNYVEDLSGKANSRLEMMSPRCWQAPCR